MNPYTYIFNNPLSGIDPTGYTAQQEPRTQGFTLKSGLVFTGASISTGRNIQSNNGKDNVGSKGAVNFSDPVADAIEAIGNENIQSKGPE